MNPSARPDPKAGSVSFIGAGPGDPELLTLRAARRLAEAEVVLIDDLAGEALLALCPQARVIPVGKRGGCKSTPQRFIEALMVREARSGRRVVRLKGGDATIFGRLNEEIAALDRAGIAWEIVPGITAGIAAAAELGVSLTDRHKAHGVAFITGHAAEGQAIDWQGLAQSGMTLVVYMGVARLDALVTQLLQGGMQPSTPVVAVERAACPEVRCIPATLADLPEVAAATALKSPAVLVIGETLAARAQALARIPLQTETHAAMRA